MQVGCSAQQKRPLRGWKDRPTLFCARTNARAKNGLLWDANSNGSFGTAESLLRSQALSLFSNINNT